MIAYTGREHAGFFSEMQLWARDEGPSKSGVGFGCEWTDRGKVMHIVYVRVE